MYCPQILRRTLTWVRGLKHIECGREKHAIMSHPYMGAWIETPLQCRMPLGLPVSHPYMGAWIETAKFGDTTTVPNRRTLTWVRGLKQWI